MAPDLPADDEASGLPAYADVVLDAIGDRTELVVVAQSFGGFTAPLVSDRVATELLVLVAGMIPSPGEPPDDWWGNTGYEREGREQDDDVIATFYHDVPPELASEALRRERAHPSARAMREPWPLEAWPDVPTRFLLCRDDRSSRPASSAASHGSAWASPRTRSTAGTASPSAAPQSWPIASRRTSTHERRASTTLAILRSIVITLSTRRRHGMNRVTSKDGTSIA